MGDASYSDLMALDLTKLGTAASDWRTMAGDLAKLTTDVRDGLTKKSDGVVQIVMETHSDHVLNGLRLTSQGLGNREEGSPRRCGTGTRSGRRGASGGSQGCSLRSSASADPVAQGSRTARSSPSRHTWLSQPRAPSRRGRSARSGCWSRSRSRISSSVISVVVAAGGQR